MYKNGEADLQSYLFKALEHYMLNSKPSRKSKLISSDLHTYLCHLITFLDRSKMHVISDSEFANVLQKLSWNATNLLTKS